MHQVLKVFSTSYKFVLLSHLLQERPMLLFQSSAFAGSQRGLSDNAMLAFQRGVTLNSCESDLPTRVCVDVTGILCRHLCFDTHETQQAQEGFVQKGPDGNSILSLAGKPLTFAVCAK